MKIRRIFVPFLILVPILLVVIPLHSQTNIPAKFNVPFAWHAGTMQLNAGTYYVSFSNLHVVHITDRDKVSIFIQHLPKGTVQPLIGKLTFRKYGSNYFLAKFAVTDTECEFAMTKVEKDYIVSIKPETTIVLAEVR